MFPEKPKINPHEQCIAITLRIDKQIEQSKIRKEGVPRNETEEAENTPSTHETIEDQNNVKDKNEEEPKYTPPKAYMPPIPFPQLLAKAKLDRWFRKFLKIMKKLYINISFIEALTQMPSYAKFLKEILSKKWKFEEYETVALTKECSALIQKKLPPK